MRNEKKKRIFVIEVIFANPSKFGFGATHLMGELIENVWH